MAFPNGIVDALIVLFSIDDMGEQILQRRPCSPLLISQARQSKSRRKSLVMCHRNPTNRKNPDVTPNASPGPNRLGRMYAGNSPSASCLGEALCASRGFPKS